MDAQPIPLIYRLIFNFFEPFMAFAGAIQLHFDAPTYLSTANPNIKYHPSLQPLFTSILGGWLMMAFNDAITLRVFARDVKVWRYILSAHLLSDLAYALAVCQDLGVARFFNPLLWNAMDWFMIGTTIPPMVLKVTFILGIGVDFSEAARLRGKKDR